MRFAGTSGVPDHTPKVRPAKKRKVSKVNQAPSQHTQKRRRDMTEGDGEMNEEGGLARSGRRRAKGVRGREVRGSSSAPKDQGSKAPKTKEGTSATRTASGED